MQLSLDFDPVDPNLPADAKPRLSNQCQLILDRLQFGPASNTELVMIAQRFGARIHDLRRHGYRIDIVGKDTEAGIFYYELKQ